MLVLAFCAGLRLRELAALKLGDLDFEENSIEVFQSKFSKSRLLTLTDRVMNVLLRYLCVRKQAGAPANPQSAFFWHTSGADGYSRNSIQILLTEVIRQAGLKPKTGRCGPRLHDLRATFAVHRLTQWYQNGVNVQSRLPYLSTYLGHKDLQGTLVYLTMTQELLNHASKRFYQYSYLTRASSIGTHSRNLLFGQWLFLSDQRSEIN